MAKSGTLLTTTRMPGSYVVKYFFSSNNTPYIISVTQCFIDALNGRHESTEAFTDQPLLTINWTQPPHRSTSAETSTGAISEWKTFCSKSMTCLLQEISTDVFQPFSRALVDAFHISYGARLLAVRGSNLLFVFWHPSEASLKKMITEKGKVYQWFQRFYRNNDTIKSDLTLTVSVKRHVSEFYLRAATGPQGLEQADSEKDSIIVDSATSFEDNVKRDLNEISEKMTALHESLKSVVSTLENLKATPKCTTPETVCPEDDRSSVKGSVFSIRVEKVAKSMDSTDGEQTLESEYDAENAERTLIVHTDPSRRQGHPEAANIEDNLHQAADTGRSARTQMSVLNFMSSDTETNASDVILTTELSGQEGNVPMAKGKISSKSSDTDGNASTPNAKTCSISSNTTEGSLGLRANLNTQKKLQSRTESRASGQVSEADNPNEDSIRAIVIQKNFKTAEEFLASLDVCVLGEARFLPRLHSIVETIALALEPPIPSPPRAVALDTILCLDISESLGEVGFQEVKTTALKFLNDIEDMAHHHDLEENIGLVVMGGRPRVVHHLTNDYGAIREAIDGLERGGKSPILEAICVCLAALKQCGSTVIIGGMSKLHPRIIFFTDGQATDTGAEDGPDEPTSEGLVQHATLLVSDQIRKKMGFSPFSWVPVGNASRMFLNNLSLGSKTLVEPKDIGVLSSYYRIEEIVGIIHSFAVSEDLPFIDESLLDHVTHLAAGDIPDAVKVRVIQRVKEKMQEKDVNSPNDFGSVKEDRDLPPLGSRVVRGPDWRFAEEDCRGPGTVIQHNPGKKLLWVRWDLSQVNHECRYGRAGCYDVIVDEDQPRLLTDNEFMALGVRVKRGPDWKFGDQDGGEGNTGVVIRKLGDVKVKVKWNQGSISSYNYGFNGLFEVMVIDPDTLKKHTTSNERSNQQNSPEASSKTTGDKTGETVEATSDKSHVVWTWLDEGETWRMYTREQMDKLESEFRRKPTGTCVIQRNGVGYRVVFKSPMSEKSVGKTVVRHPVKRVAIDDE